MTAQTKTVQGYFGEKQVSREEYVKQWTSHFSEVFHLSRTVQEYDELKAMKERIAQLAGNRWEDLK